MTSSAPSAASPAIRSSWKFREDHRDGLWTWLKVDDDLLDQAAKHCATLPATIFLWLEERALGKMGSRPVVISNQVGHRLSNAVA